MVQLCFFPNRESGRSFSMIDWSGSPACLSVRFAPEAVPSMLNSRAPLEFNMDGTAGDVI